MEEPVFFYSEGQKIFANIHIPENGGPCILMSHGFESSKDGSKWRILAPRLSDAGFAILRFSYRGCGEGAEKSEGEFEDTSLSGRTKDYEAAIDYLQNTEVDIKKLGVIGSSFGGMTALAAKDKRVKAMVVLSTPSRFSSPSDQAIEQFREKGYFELGSGRRLALDFFADSQKYDILRNAKEIGCPLLIIHSSRDEVVPVENAHELYAHAEEPKKLEIIEGASHSFDNADHLERVINLSMEWFKRYL